MRTRAYRSEPAAAAARGGPRTGSADRAPAPDAAAAVDVVERLDAEGLLPAIVFIFSRAGCDAAVQQCLDAGCASTTPEERAEIRADRRGALRRACPTTDLDVLGYDEFLRRPRARASPRTTPGMLPAFKEVVEELFSRA